MVLDELFCTGKEQKESSSNCFAYKVVFPVGALAQAISLLKMISVIIYQLLQKTVRCLRGLYLVLPRDTYCVLTAGTDNHQDEHIASDSIQASFLKVILSRDTDEFHLKYLLPLSFSLSAIRFIIFCSEN